MTLFTQNGKMQKTSKLYGVAVYNFGIPAYKSIDGTLTCPMADKCISGCYARQGAYGFSSTKTAYESRLALTRNSEAFKLLTMIELDKLLAKNKGKVVIRIHDSGDFYNRVYAETWLSICKHYENNDRIVFYTYTKMIKMMKALAKPSNLTIIYSYGGLQDQLIDAEQDHNARVFSSLDDLLKAGYIDASQDDLTFLLTKKIGLVYHGVKKYTNTGWSNAV